MSCTTLSETWRARDAEPTLDLMDLSDHRPFALLQGTGRYAVLGRGPLLTKDDFDLGTWHFERRGDMPSVLPDFMGFATYESGCALEPLVAPPLPSALAMPEIHFSVYREVCVLDRHTCRLHECVREGCSTEDDRVHALGDGAFAAQKEEDTEDAATYQEKAAFIREEIARGNVYQVNLTRQEQWRFQGDLRSFARRLMACSPAPYSAVIAGPDWSLVSNSPECFLSIQEGRITTRPIKGTAPRGAWDGEDTALRDALLASSKNLSELAMIVDLLRNDLARVCELPGVRVDAFPVLESYANVHHLVASLSGRLRQNVTLRELFRALFPGGSVTGCPKIAAMQLIRNLESAPRQVYCGALGWLRHDLAQGELALPIRTAWAAGGVLRFGVGGAVVWDSDPAEEYLETLHKGRSLVQCLCS